MNSSDDLQRVHKRMLQELSFEVSTEQMGAEFRETLEMTQKRLITILNQEDLQPDPTSLHIPRND